METGDPWKALCPWDWRLPMESSPVLFCLSQLYVQWKQWWMAKSQVCIEYTYPQIKKDVWVGNTYFRIGDSPRKGDRAQRGDAQQWPEEHECLRGGWKRSTWRRLNGDGQSTRARSEGVLLLQAPRREEGEDEEADVYWVTPQAPILPFLQNRTSGARLWDRGLSQLEASEKTFSEDMDGYDVACEVRQDWLCHTRKKEWNDAICSNLMDLEIIILNEVSWRQISSDIAYM